METGYRNTALRRLVDSRKHYATRKVQESYLCFGLLVREKRWGSFILFDFSIFLAKITCNLAPGKSKRDTSPIPSTKKVQKDQRYAGLE